MTNDPTFNSAPSPNDMLQLLSTGLREGQYWATDFANRVLKDIESQIKNVKLKSTPILIDGEAISETINENIKKGVQKSVDTTINNIRESTEKISKDIKVDNEISISSLLGMTPRMGIINSLKFSKITGTLINALSTAANDVANNITIGDSVGFGDIFRPSGPAEEIKFKTTQSSLSTNWIDVQTKFISKISDAVNSAKFDFDKNINLASLFSPLDGKQFKGKAKSLSEKWLDLQGQFIKKITASLKDFEIGGLSFDKITKPDSDGGGADGEFQSLEENNGPSAVIIEGISGSVLDKLAPIIKEGFKGIDIATGDTKSKSKSIIDALGPYAKLAIAGLGLISGGLLVGISGLFDDGPFKGFKKVLSRTMIKIGDWLVKHTAPKVIEHVTKLFTSIGDDIIKVFKSVGSGLGKGIVSQAGKMGGMMAKVGARILKFAKPILNKIPGIGAIMGIGFGISRIMKGDIIGGILDFASGIASTFPGPGTAISVAIDVLSAARDMGAFGEKSKVSFSLASFLSKILKFVKPVLKRIPGLGAIMGLGFAFKRIKDGDIFGGILEAASGIASILPGPGTAISIALDVLLAAKDGVGSGALKKAGNFLKGIASAIGGFFSKYKYSIPVIGPLLRIGDAIGQFWNGDVKGGFRSLLLGMAGVVPGIGLLLNPVIEWLFTEETTTDPSTGETRSVSLAERFRDAFKEKVKSWCAFLPSWMRNKIFSAMGIEEGPEEATEPIKPITEEQQAAGAANRKAKYAEMAKKKAERDANEFNNSNATDDMFDENGNLKNESIPATEQAPSSPAPAAEPINNIEKAADTTVEPQDVMEAKFKEGEKQELIRYAKFRLKEEQGIDKPTPEQISSMLKRINEEDNQIAASKNRVENVSSSVTQTPAEPIVSETAKLEKSVRQTGIATQQATTNSSADLAKTFSSGVDKMSNNVTHGIKNVVTQVSSPLPQPPPPTPPKESLPSVGDSSIRDPAYELRSKVWGIINGRQVLI